LSPRPVTSGRTTPSAGSTGPPTAAGPGTRCCLSTRRPARSISSLIRRTRTRSTRPRGSASG
jgi:hypothetical protein